jgi:hypothetical protein
MTSQKIVQEIMTLCNIRRERELTNEEASKLKNLNKQLASDKSYLAKKKYTSVVVYSR